ncbi:hypothetical protein IT402_02320 [Candidatus Nomurabacteria bacterium]|nr:hypothetical protein [Candidatus Nomurabacteria bacterium]
MSNIHPHELFEELKKEFSIGMINIIGPIIKSNGDNERMLYSLIEKDPGLIKDQDIDYPELFTENVRKYKDYPEIYEVLHRNYPNSISSGVYGGNTHINVPFDLLESYFVDFFIDKKFNIKFLHQRNIPKKHRDLKESTGTIDYLFCIACQEKVAVSFHSFCGYISKEDMADLFNLAPSFVFNCWGSLHFS